MQDLLHADLTQRGSRAVLDRRGLYSALAPLHGLPVDHATAKNPVGLA